MSFSAASSSKLRQRPPFPSGWSSLPISPRNLTLANTLPVGQSFLWHRHQLRPAQGPDDTGKASIESASVKREARSATPVASPPADPVEEFSRAIEPGIVVCLRQTDTHIFYAGVGPDGAPVPAGNGSALRAWLNDYFQLDKWPDLEALYAEWRARDPGLFGRAELDGRATGVRVLRQDPWECLIAFITSTNNHIPRITSLMHKLSRLYSSALLELADPASLGGPADASPSTAFYLFPRPHVLPAELEGVLRETGFGYRAGFIESTLATLRAQFGEDAGAIEAGLDAWRTAPVDEVRTALVALKGVGRKVADCVMLMSLDRPELIPVDTHVGAIAARHPSFPSRLRHKPMSKQVYDETQEFLADAWGPMGGWCQAVMFAADLPATLSTPKRGGSGSQPGTPSRSPLATPKTEAPPRDLGSGGAPVAPLTPTALRGDPLSPLATKKREAGPTARDMPASAGFKRTRSATRVELLRSESTGSVTAMATEVVKLEVKP